MLISIFCFQSVLGKLVQRPAKLDKKLARELKGLADPTTDPYDTVIGKTMCTHDFYEGKNNDFSTFFITFRVLGVEDKLFCEFSLPAFCVDYILGNMSKWEYS